MTLNILMWRKNKKKQKVTALEIINNAVILFMILFIGSSLYTFPGHILFWLHIYQNILTVVREMKELTARVSFSR